MKNIVLLFSLIFSAQFLSAQDTMKNQILKFSFFLLIIIGVYSCTPNTCANGIQDGTETGIDCGGDDCLECMCSGNGEYTINTNIGILILNTQEQVDSFASYKYEKIIGEILISGNEVTSLKNLCSIKKVKGSLHLQNILINNLDGLQNIDSIDGSIIIENCNKILNLDELNGLLYLSSGISLQNNAILENLNGLKQLSSKISYVALINNESLTNIDGLSALQINQSFLLNYNNSLEYIPEIKLIKNPLLSVQIKGFKSNLNLDFLQGIDSMGILTLGANNFLNNLDNLSSIESLRSLYITNNENLENFCGIQNAINNGISNYSVYNNLYNPTFQDLQNGDCTP